MLPTTSFSVLLLLKLPWPLQVSKGTCVLGCWLLWTLTRQMVTLDCLAGCMPHAMHAAIWRQNYSVRLALHAPGRHSPVMPNDKESPEHGALCEPVRWPCPPAATKRQTEHCNPCSPEGAGDSDT